MRPGVIAGDVNETLLELVVADIDALAQELTA
jgi:hypothetical protein